MDVDGRQRGDGQGGEVDAVERAGKEHSVAGVGGDAGAGDERGALQRDACDTDGDAGRCGGELGMRGEGRDAAGAVCGDLYVLCKVIPDIGLRMD